jgi:hypothetical protein
MSWHGSWLCTLLKCVWGTKLGYPEQQCLTIQAFRRNILSSSAIGMKLYKEIKHIITDSDRSGHCKQRYDEEFYLLRAPLRVSWRFRGTRRLQFQGPRMSQARDQSEAGSKAATNLAYSSTLKIRATCSCKTSVRFQRNTRRYIPKDTTLHNHRCENLKSYNTDGFRAVTTFKSWSQILTFIYVHILLEWLYSRFFFSDSWSYTQSVGLLGRVISSSQDLCLNTGQHKHRKTHIHTKHPWPKWDLIQRSQRPSERSQFMPQTARLPWILLVQKFYVLHVPLWN